MPLFAFANAGVSLSNISLTGDAFWVFAGILLGLSLGKPLGIFALSRLSTQLRVAALPRGMRWPDVGVVGMVGGIGFTMALFIAQLAFPDGPFLETAKLGVLCGSGFAAICSLVAGYRILTPSSSADSAATEAEAEGSTTA
jgi:NhaA family Na+:H+ antiporter